MSPNDLYISSISFMEIEYGLQKNPKKAELIRTVLQDFLNSIHQLEFGNWEAKSAALLRADLEKRGTPIGSYDLLIAATALHHHLTLITSNISEFQRVKDLVFENWR